MEECTIGALQISLFRGVQIVHDGRPSRAKVTRTVQALLAYLLLQRHRFHPREVLAGTFWGDHTEGRARSCSSTALWRLRQVLEPEGIPRQTYLATTPGGEVGFNSESDYWLDVAIFESQAGRILDQPVQTAEAADLKKLEQVLSLLYRRVARRVLRGLGAPGAGAAACPVPEQPGVSDELSQTLRRLRKNLACGQQILEQDPLREEVHREMMRLYTESGQRALAVRQYRICSEVLNKELDIPPMEETRTLYAGIVSKCGRHPARPTPGRGPTRLQQAVERLHRAARNFDEAREQLQRAIWIEAGAGDLCAALRQPGRSRRPGLLRNHALRGPARQRFDSRLSIWAARMSSMARSGSPCWRAQDRANLEGVRQAVANRTLNIGFMPDYTQTSRTLLPAAPATSEGQVALAV